MEAVIAGLVAYHLIMLRAVGICRTRELNPSRSFAVGVMAGLLFVVTIHLIGYVATRQTMLANGVILLSLLIYIWLPLLVGLGCLDALRKDLQL